MTRDIVLCLMLCDVIWCHVISHDDIDTVNNILHSERRPESQINSHFYFLYHMISCDIIGYHRCPMMSADHNATLRMRDQTLSRLLSYNIIGCHLMSADVIWCQKHIILSAGCTTALRVQTPSRLLSYGIIWYQLTLDDIIYDVILPYRLLTASSVVPAMWRT